MGYRILASLLLAAVAAHAQTALKATDTVNVRTGPGTGYAIMGQVPSGHTYVGISKSGDWWKIYFDGRVGWTHGSYYTSPSGTTGVKVTTDTLNVRSGPGTGYSIKGQVYSGQIYFWTQYEGLNGWYKIYWGGGIGYVHGSYVVKVALGSSSSSKIGLDINEPFGENVDADRIAATGTRWVRVNFIGDDFAHYDSVVNTLRAKGIQIYMLVGSQATSDPGDTLRHEWSSNDGWIADYAAKFVQVVDHFKDRVRVFETYNEPNDWAGGTTHKVHPKWMAKILQEVYLNTKHFNGHAGVAAWQVTIVSGPLFSFDGTTAADYLADVYWYGKQTLAWDWTREQTGSYPLDGIGYHIYVAQDASQLGEVEWRVKGNVDAVWSVVGEYEGATSKRLWISEIGWPSSQSESFQAQALTKGLSTLKADWRVALAIAFCQVDFPDGPWGLFRSDWSKKPAYDAFRLAH